MATDDPYYRSLCNSLTLYSEKKGFFQEFADNVTSIAGSNWLKNRFATLKTDEERIRHCFSDEETGSIVQGTLDNVQKLFRSKYAVISRQKREEAEHLQYNGKLNRGILIANQGVARAPATGVDKKVDDGFTLPLCIWVRAKLFFENKDYDLCLADIKLALKYKLPDEHKLDAYLKMALCYTELGEKDKARVSLTIVNKFAKEKSQADIVEKTVEMLSKLDSLVHKPVKVDDANEPPKVSEPGNKSYPRATSGLEVVSTEKAGRTMVTKTRINTGDVVVVEPAFSWALLTDKCGTHCLHCFSRVKRLVPCLECSGIAFCSSKCQEEGMVYHKWECSHLELMIGSGMSVLTYLSLRIITQRPLQFFTKLKNRIPDQTFKHPYLDIYRLEGHEGRREPRDMLHRTVMALFLTRILRGAGYFGKDTQCAESLTEDEVYISSLMLRHLQVLQYNAHEIYETVYKSDKMLKTAKTVNIGIGIYPTVSMFNHNCYPAVTRYFCGNTIVIRSVRPLMPGEIVPENYGPVFTMKSLEERQRSLSSRYLFNCDCVACAEDWPKLEDIKTNIIKFRCSTKTCSGNFFYKEGLKMWKCKLCSKETNSEELYLLYVSYNRDFEEAVKLVDQGDCEKPVPIFINFINQMSALVRAPNKNLSLAQEALRTCWANKANVFTV